MNARESARAQKVSALMRSRLRETKEAALAAAIEAGSTEEIAELEAELAIPSDAERIDAVEMALLEMLMGGM